MEEIENTVDLSAFFFDSYFPPEHYGESLVSGVLYTLFPFASWIRRRRQSYKPLTLEMLDKAIHNGAWKE